MRAISPVIATVIIVSVAIAIAVAVAFWMTGITGLFTRYERLEIVSAYATGSQATGFTIHLTVKNTGTTIVTIDEVFINGKPYTGTPTYTGFSDHSLEPGKEGKIEISLDTGYISGQIVEVKLHTAAGNEYPKSVQLP